jgi:hypothetical protein
MIDPEFSIRMVVRKPTDPKDLPHCRDTAVNLTLLESHSCANSPPKSPGITFLRENRGGVGWVSLPNWLG